MTPLEVLQSARELISDPDKWVQGHIAVDRNGEYTNAASPYACRFCALGSLFRCTVGQPSDVYDDAVAVLASATPGSAIATYNDSRTHAEVLAVFDHAIAIERSRQ